MKFLDNFPLFLEDLFLPEDQLIPVLPFLLEDLLLLYYQICLVLLVLLYNPLSP